MTGLLNGAVYAHAVSWDVKIEPALLHDIVFRQAARQPRAIAIDFYGRRTTYGELGAQVRRMAAGFLKLGLGPGARVGLFLPNCPQYVVAYYGALAAGATVVNFSPLYSPEELEAQAADAGVDTIVCLDVASLFGTISQLIGSGALRRLIVARLAASLPFAKGLGARLFKAKAFARVPSDERHIAYEDLVRTPEVPLPGVDLDQLAVLQYTGGTTGRPKGAILTHRTVSINAQQTNIMDPNLDAEDRVLVCLPFFHVFANTAVLNRTMVRGGELVILPKFEAGEVLAAIKRRRITLFHGVPTMYAALCEHPAAKAMDWSSLRLCVSGGAPIAVELLQRFEAMTGCRLAEGYGLTETSGVATTTPFEGPRKLGSVGQPIPGTNIIIVDKDDPTRPVPIGEPGEITIGGPQIMRGYLHSPNDDPVAFVDGRLRTGDIGYLDEDGFLFVVDRMKDMIVVGGFKVFPSRLEDVLYTHPAVLEALVVPTPDARLGERPKAFVALRPGTSATPAELLELVNAHVGKHERPVAVEIRESLPKTLVGKLSRKELASEERARAGA